MKYMIDDYQLIKTDDTLYLGNYGIGAKIPNEHLGQILATLKNQAKLEIQDEALVELATSHNINPEKLKEVLIDKLNILKPHSSRKCDKIFINTDDVMMAEMVQDGLSKEYEVEIQSDNQYDYPAKSLVLYFRKNYSHQDFKQLYQNLPDNVYIVTAGIIHKTLIIDNLYFNHSGLPSHFSNLNNLLACVHNDIAITKNNWLLFYRQLMKKDIDTFPDPQISKSQTGYIAYCLERFLAQFTNFWKLPTTLDEVNWFWHVDLTSFSVNREVAIHSPYSEYDMNLDISKLAEKEVECL